MKKVMIAGGMLLFSLCSQGQNKTIKLYIQQIAANQVYIEYLQKGYRIAKNGLTTISNIKNGHWSLDKDFFAGLIGINPKIRNYTKVADIIALHITIARKSKTAMKQARSADLFNNSETSYFDKVFAALSEACTDLTDELTQILTPNKLTMSDDERIKRIDRLYSNMQDAYAFAESFSNDINVMALQRSKGLNEATTVRVLYGQ
ncbi:MAG: hypothetical protein QM763_14370 [Agriterribacter sp.]